VEVSGASYVRGAADMLYDVLGNPTVQKGRVPLLVACNKMDLSSAHTAEFTRKRLEKEMEILRSSRASMQDTTTARGGSGSGAAAASIGKPGQPFSFESCSNAITCAATSVLQNELMPVYDFLETSY
jgi:signal recognition particle receptor subunit beta